MTTRNRCRARRSRASVIPEEHERMSWMNRAEQPTMISTTFDHASRFGFLYQEQAVLHAGRKEILTVIV